MLAFWPPLAQLSFPDTTQYASEFTEKKFSEVKSGMSMNAVQALLGTPIRRGAGWWDYTQSGGSYHVRRIYFSHEGKVIRKKAYYAWRPWHLGGVISSARLILPRILLTLAAAKA